MSNDSSLPSKAQRRFYGEGEWLSYHHSPPAVASAQPGILFLGGFKSDMQGTKAMHLERFCRGKGMGYTRFDYAGHGESSGAFAEGTIGGWVENVALMLDEVVQGPQILVGSSMGGWLMLLAALQRPERVSGLVGIAAAPDFTEDLIWEALDEAAQQEIMQKGMYLIPNCYEGEEAYPITRRLIEEGREHLLLRQEKVEISCPVRLIHGMRDEDVPWGLSVTLAEKLAAEDVQVTLVKDGDHRMSAVEPLRLLEGAIRGLIHNPA